AHAPCTTLRLTVAPLVGIVLGLMTRTGKYTFRFRAPRRMRSPSAALHRGLHERTRLSSGVRKFSPGAQPRRTCVLSSLLMSDSQPLPVGHPSPASPLAV